MAPLAPDLRRDLEKAVVTARRLAEAGARAAVARLGVEAAEAPGGQSPDLRALRTALRERAKALGGGVRALGINPLVEEIAYEQWHRMLFARFLAENDLLLHPEGGPVSLADVRELAAEEGERDPWVLAARYAARMLPGIFRADDPANRVAFAPEDRSRMEAVLEGLPASLFKADDALGWVYQFWQSERKDEVNRRGNKIGGDDLPSVTQLFTEHYMVRFLLENSLGAWWAARHPNSPVLREWEYLRFGDDGTPAAGTFDDWPQRAAEITVMDPCCGSGHFLVAAADMLRRMRMEEEGLNATQAAIAVIRDNLFGLELDSRCLQLAAFNLALDAWRTGGYQPLPIPNLACTGIAIKGQRADWHRLASGDAAMVEALDRLYNLFQDAPELGSLIDPRAAAGEGLWAVDVNDLLAKLDRALTRETAADPAAAVFGAAAAATAKAAQLLSRRYWLVATNPPFLGRGQMDEKLAAHVLASHPAAKDDLAAAILLRAMDLLLSVGALAGVVPQYVFFLRMFGRTREAFRAFDIAMLARLGSGAFETIGGDVVKVGLAVVRRDAAAGSDTVATIDADAADGRAAKERALRETGLVVVLQGNGKDPFDFTDSSSTRRLSEFARAWQGLVTTDLNRFAVFFWEVPIAIGSWVRFISAPDRTGPYRGRSLLLRWEGGDGALVHKSAAHNFNPRSVLGRRGVLVAQASRLPVTLYIGEFFNDASSPMVPRDEGDLAAIWSFCSSPAYHDAVRARNQKLIVGPGYLTDVPFDLEHWQKVAAEQYPNGLPEPHSDDPTQWLFGGNVVGSESPLQVAVARLLGYRWPDQEPDSLDELTDADGLVPLVSVSGERPAAERLRALLARAYGDAWSPTLLDRLLTEAGSPGARLETWLRDDFFAQHVKLFQQRPFIWHVWDGRKDGFSVLCHYHRLDRAKLEKLTYTLLGDWIERQEVARDEPGAEDRLVAAQRLKDQLIKIIEGEAPFDIYVRWKSLAEQPIGWEPDLDDGVRLNLRPFVTAGVLRSKVNVKWDKDRGKNPDGSERTNDRHPTLAEKRTARAPLLTKV